jgi:hypothetical protein
VGVTAAAVKPTRRARARLALVTSAPWRWWRDLDASERVLYRAIALLAAGFALAWPPAGLIVPGLLYTAVFFKLTWRAG